MLQPKGPVCESVAVTRVDTSRLSKRREWTNEAIDGLQPPADGMERNYTGLLYNLRLYGISPSEQYAIIRKVTLESSVIRYGKVLVPCGTVVGKLSFPDAIY